MYSVIYIFVFLIVLTGCGLSKEGRNATSPTCPSVGIARLAGTPPNTPANVETFRTTLYAAINQDPMKCANCHSSMGPKAHQTPYFADSDLTSAFNSAIALVDFGNAANSAVVQFSHNGHCGSTECLQSSAQPMTAAVQAWINAVSGTTSGTPAPQACPIPSATPGPASPYQMTQAQQVPAQLPVHSPAPSPDTFTPMTYPLDSLGPDFHGAIFSIEIQQWQIPTTATGGAYRFTRPRLSVPSNTGAIHLKEIHIFVNGKEDAEWTTFYNVDTIVTNEPHLNAPLLSAMTSVPVAETNSHDQISIGFLKLEKTAMPSCKHVAQFQQNVLGAAGSQNTMTAKCMSCHANPQAPAYAHFQMDGTLENLCVRTLTRTIRGPNGTEAYVSPIIKNPINGENGHSVVSFDPSLWINWINSER
jgi:hypothetical protein